MAQEDLKEKKTNFVKKVFYVIAAYAGLVFFLSTGPTISDIAKKRFYQLTDKVVVAYIPIKETISSESSKEVIQCIENAKEDGINNYVFEVNSGGGEVVPSEDISNKINEVERGLDGIKGSNDDAITIALIKGVGASGAYWIASAADYIVASRNSLVGSIGVRAGFFNFSGLMKKLGIEYRDIKSGANKTMGSPFREPTGEELEQLEKLISGVHKNFIRSVAKNRNMPYAEIEALADGGVWLGSEALEKKLIDKIGGLDAAKARIKEIRKKDKSKIIFIKYEKAKPFFFNYF